MSTAFVTGANGCLGVNLVRALQADGWRVVAMHRASSAIEDLAPLGAERVVGDVTDLASVLEAMPSGVDVVFHVAGDTTLWARARDRQRRVNVGGTSNVVEASRRRRAGRLVLTSSAAVLCGHGGTVDERARPIPAALQKVGYCLTKWEGEELVRGAVARGLDAVILNPGNFTGPYDRANWSRFFFLVRDGKLPGVPPGRWSWAHAVEVARAHVAAARRGRAGEAWLLAGADATMVEVCAIMGELLDRPPPSRVVPASVLRGLGWAKHLASLVTGKEPDITPEGVQLLLSQPLFDCGKAVRELGYRAAPLREILADCHGWLREAGLL